MCGVTGDVRISAWSHFPFFSLHCSLSLWMNWRAQEHIVDVAVGWLAYGSTTCFLNGGLVYKVSTGVAS